MGDSSSRNEMEFIMLKWINVSLERRLTSVLYLIIIDLFFHEMLHNNYWVLTRSRPHQRAFNHKRVCSVGLTCRVAVTNYVTDSLQSESFLTIINV